MKTYGVFPAPDSNILFKLSRYTNPEKFEKIAYDYLKNNCKLSGVINSPHKIEFYTHH